MTQSTKQQQYMIDTEYGFLAEDFENTPYPTYHNGLTYCDDYSSAELFDSEEQAQEFINDNDLRNARIVKF